VQHTVLVVDDDADIRESLCMVLEDEGYRARSAGDGVEAVERMRAEAPCFVILDLMMPVMDGWEVAGRMREEKRLAVIPVCVVTATPEWAPADAQCVLAKPIDLSRLLAIVRGFCDDARHADAWH